jgi:hypothetical protein
MLLLLGCAGCGLADYEAEMIKSQDRLARFEEEARHLEGPLNFPKRQKLNPEEPDPPEFFFRPPRGLSIDPAKDSKDQVLQVAISRDVTLYHFKRPAKDANPGAPAQKEANPGLTDLHIAMVVDPSEKVSKDMVQDVLRYFQAPRDLAPEKRPVTTMDGRTLTYDTYKFLDPKNKFTYYICFIRMDKALVALVFQIEPDKLASLTQALDASLKSLGVGSEATPARQSWEEAMRRLPPRK